MFTSLQWQAWVTIAAVGLLIVAGAFGGGVALGWRNRDELAKAQHTAAISQADASTARTQANVNSHAGELGVRTANANAATHRAEERGRLEIANAVSQEDFDALDAAWRSSRVRVWLDAGLAPAPSGDPSQPEPDGRVRASHSA